MTDRVDHVPADVWSSIVATVPIPSVDLVVQCPDGILLARRQNEPARGEWFVPGGRIHKGEPLRDAVDRVAREELGIDVTIERDLGAYDHFYETADVPEAGGKHYVAHGYLVRTASTDVTLDDQHDQAQVFPVENLPALHDHVQAYLRDAGVLA